MTRKKSGGMRNRAGKAAKEATKRLYEKELEILKKTTIDWKKLRPEVTNIKTYDRLIAVVKESTGKNESIAELKDRIKKLGNEAIVMARKVARLAK